MSIEFDFNKTAEESIKKMNESNLSIILRAIAQSFPITAGIMSVLDSKSNDIFQKRIFVLLRSLEERVSILEINYEKLSVDSFDLFTLAFEKVIKSRTDDKIARFAAIIGNYFEHIMEKPEDAFSAIQLCAELEDIHIEILKTALEGPRSVHFPSPIIILNEERTDLGKLIYDQLPHYDKVYILIACQKLLSLGILYDASIGKAMGGPMQVLSPTSIASWFIEQIV